jgi:tRNA (guanine26-N2/guanine27-N2)-dimethyltransferase
MTGKATTASGEPVGDPVEHNGKKYLAFQEGKATILMVRDYQDAEGGAPADDKSARSDRQVFYNPIQQFNRDLTVLAIRTYGTEVLGRRKAAWRARLAKFADKKRKRKEAAPAAEPPAKLAKHDDAAPLTPPEQTEETASAVERHGDTARPEGAQVDDVVSTGPTAEDSGIKSTEADAAGEADGADRQQSPVDRQQDADEEKAAAPFTILDALSATGLRALRYAQEIPFATSITAVDMSKPAVETIRTNVDYNGVGRKVHAIQDDALAHMYSLIARELRQPAFPRSHKSDKYDVIDLDPYGTAVTFFDAAVQAVRNDGGLLCITCTDTGVWASNAWAEKAFSLYGGVTMKGVHSHEAGLRLILHALATSAARYGMTIEPLLSLSIDFYGRLFVRIRRSPAAVKFHASKTMLVYNCDAGCGAWSTQPLLRNRQVQQRKAMGYKHSYAAGPTASEFCDHCGIKRHVAGPMWAGRLHSPAFIEAVLEEVSAAEPDTFGTLRRIEGMLTTALEETIMYPEAESEGRANGTSAPLDDGSSQQPSESEWAIIDPYPFFFIPSQLSAIMHCQTPGEHALRGALLGLGFRVTRSHCKPGSMKTDAPWSVIWHVMREWVRQKSPIKNDSVKPGMAGFRILGLDGSSEVRRDATGNHDKPEPDDRPVIFDEEKGRYKERKLMRYQHNPRENWGPMTRARGT